MCRVKLEKDIAERDRLVAKLGEYGREEGTCVLFFRILEVKKEVGYVCRPGVGDTFDILNDRRTIVIIDDMSNPCQKRILSGDIHKDAFAGSRYQI